MAQLLSRRTFLMLTSASIASLAFGCKASEKSDSEWMWAQDDELDVLSMQVAGGAIVAIPGKNISHSGKVIGDFSLFRRF